MVGRLLKNFSVLLIVGINPLSVALAQAALGGDAASVVADADAMRGVVHFELLQLYDIHEITTGGGMRVREFLTRGGVVFAVTWTGPVMPDLRRLLGMSFAAYTAALSNLQRPGLQRSLRIASPELVVENGGHLRAYGGRAYLPQLLPAGAATAELR